MGAGRPWAGPEARSAGRSLGPVYRGMEHKWWVDELYRHDLRAPLRTADPLSLAQPVDQGLIDGIVNGLATLSRRVAAGLVAQLQNGYVRSYAMVIFLGVVLILGYLVLLR